MDNWDCQLQVVGGASGGGILVREGEKLGSAELPTRLATGAIVRQKVATARLGFWRVLDSHKKKNVRV